MTTSDRSQQTDFFGTELDRTLLPEDFPAKTSQLRGDKQALRESEVDYGASLPVLLASYNHDTRSWKTSQTSLVATADDGLDEFLETWPRSGMTRNGIAYQLPRLAPTITEIGSGLWPTPRAQEAKHGAPTEWEMTTDHAGTRESLRVQVNRRAFWPTPHTTSRGARSSDLVLNSSTVKRRHSGQKRGMDLQTAVKYWPTPSTRDYKGGYNGGRIRNGKVSWDTLDVAVQHTDNQNKTSGALNPTWVEWLMGFPLGHTDLKLSETQ